MSTRFTLIGWFCFVGIVASPLMGMCQVGSNEIIYGEVGELTSLDPLANDEIAIRLVELIFDGLVGFDEKGNPVPELAERVEVSSDKKVYTFHLRKGIQWHGSSKQVSADDVKFTFDGIKSTPSAWRDALNFVEAVTVQNPNTVQITLKQPVHAAEGRLSFKILPSSNPGSFDKALKSRIGTGSFRYQPERGDTIHLVANKNAIHKPYIDGIYQRSFDDSDIATQALVTGDIHLMPDFPIDRLPLIREELRKKPYNLLSIACIGYNMRKPYLQDKRVRRAFTMALNKQGLLERLYYGEGEVIWGPYPPTSAANYNIEEINARYCKPNGIEGIPQFRKGGDGKPSSVDIAAQLIADARREGKFTDRPLVFKAIAPSKGEIQTRGFIFQAYSDALKAIGVEVKYDPVERGAWKKAVFEDHDFDITYIEWSFGDLMDITPLFHSRHRGPNQDNIVGYQNPEVDKLLEDSLTATPNALVETIYPELCAIIGDDCPYTFLWSLVRYTGYHKKLHIERIDPFTFFEFVDGWYIKE